ncbi:transcriptional regulator of the forkhead/HNF3 family [Scheffersomyces xylosifermentans]|uniref:transcriptional regulator of the forkhead/HNF3 family n=1 Tax=Scheffersomyces xylosifermentans TaxID=1304137 RepID=UPI00315D8DB2
MMSRVGDDSGAVSSKNQSPQHGNHHQLSREDSLRLNIEDDGSATGTSNSHDEISEIHGLSIDEELNSILDNRTGSDRSESKNIFGSGKNPENDELNLKSLGALDLDPLDKINHPVTRVATAEFADEDHNNRTVSNSQSPNPEPRQPKSSKGELSSAQKEIRRNASFVPITLEAALDRSSSKQDDADESSKISAYARLDFDNFTFFVQTLQVVLGRKSNDELLHSSHHAVDVHLSSKKAISRRHAKIFYNFGTQRFEISILGRNGAFVDDSFVEKGMTVPLTDGTKLQIGDIPFSFVLPSIEPSEEHEFNATSGKQFNPTDAINLRSNIYSTSKSPTPKKSPKKDSKPEKEDDEVMNPVDEVDVDKKPAAKVEVMEEKNEKTKQRTNSISSNRGKQPLREEPLNESKSQTTSRRNSLLKIRRLSNARRKSLASSANDEINDILKELGVASIDAINEEDSELLDSQIQSLLDEHDNEDMGLEENLLKLAQYTESAIEDEEDEIDRLVKQHNMEQGVNLDEDSMDNDTNTRDIDLDLSILDQEIATLAPLIDAHNQELMKEKEEKKKKLEREKKRKQQLQKKNAAGNKPGPSSPPSSQNISPSIRNAPLMGKPAVPRMGKPASIQPPSSRLYINGAGKPQNNTIPTSPASHLATGSSGISGSVLPLGQGTPFSPIVTPVGPPRPPPPKLEVPVTLITSEPSAIRSRPPLRAITVKPTANLANYRVPKTNEEPSKFPKQKRRRDLTRKPNKRVYTIDEIPDQFRSKPNISYPVMITTVLKSDVGKGGLTINEINEAIKEFYPYYKYCPDGWQFSIAHNVKLTKTFRRTVKRGIEWVYTVDELYINEREKVRKKQQEMAAAKAKEAAIRAEELKQKQRLETQRAMTQNIVGRSFSSPYGLPINTAVRSPQSPYVGLPYKQTGIGAGSGDQKPKTIAELASEIRRDGNIGSKAPMYFKPQSTVQAETGSKANSGTGQAFPPNTTIKAQLAANRSPSNSQSPPPTSSSVQSQTPSSKAEMTQDTKKSLGYLQKELFTLYKARNLSYNKATTTDIITKALATTIAQVNVIGSKAGYGDNALSFLVEKAPQQVSKILDIALTKSIREKQGINSSRPTSRAGTPAPPSSVSSPAKTQIGQIVTPSPATPANASPSHQQTRPIAQPVPKVEHGSPQNPSLKQPATSQVAAPQAKPVPHAVNVSDAPAQEESKPSPSVSSVLAAPPTAPRPSPSIIDVPATAAPASTAGFSSPTAPSLSKPSFGAGLSRPPSYKSDSMGRPPNIASSLSRPQSFGKPAGSLSRPPTFLSNKPGLRPNFNSESATSATAAATAAVPGSGENNKREFPDDNNDSENARKIIKTE